MYIIHFHLTMQIDSSHIIKMIPKTKDDILNSIIYYGGFLQTYNNLMRFVESEESSTAILRGGPGSGKKTLLHAVEKNFNFPDVNVRQDNYQSSRKSMKGTKDDYTTLKYIATKLNLKIRPSIQDIIEDIEARKGIEHDGKIIVVLFNFEEFCNQKQSLLYSLTHLTQHGKNINLLGVTASLDCTKGLEKRVRSRLNALFYELTLPYNSMEQYLEFASKLLGDYKITGNIKQSLEEMYIYGRRNITELKRFLMTICTWDNKGKLIIKQPDVDSRKSKSLGSYFELENELDSLVEPQIVLLAIAVSYCYEKKTAEFSLAHLDDYIRKKNIIKNYQLSCPQFISHSILLERIKLFKTVDTKPNITIGEYSKFTLEISHLELKSALGKYKTKVPQTLWKNLK